MKLYQPERSSRVLLRRFTHRRSSGDAASCSATPRGREIQGHIVAQVPDLEKRCIVTLASGSDAYGFYDSSIRARPRKDIDVIVVFVAEASYYLSWSTLPDVKPEWPRIDGYDFDVSFFEIKKFMLQLLKSSPTVLPHLWNRDQEVYFCDSAFGKELLSVRTRCVSKEIFPAFFGLVTKMKHDIDSKYREDAEAKRKAFTHAIRIARLGTELLSEGRCFPYREGRDLEELLAIRAGEISEKETRNILNDVLLAFERARDRTQMPAVPDVEAIRALTEKIVRGKIAMDI